jgi:hypothetical protein
MPPLTRSLSTPHQNPICEVFLKTNSQLQRHVSHSSSEGQASSLTQEKAARPVKLISLNYSSEMLYTYPTNQSDSREARSRIQQQRIVDLIVHVHGTVAVESKFPAGSATSFVW